MSSLPITLEQLLASPISPYCSRPRDEDVGCDEMVLGIPGNAALPPVLQNHHPEQLQQQLLLCESSGEEQEPRQPKKRAETWVQEETRILISLRREMDARFNTTKSNKHLWDKISAKMRDMGFDRSSNMCIDKWRNLLKEFKKAKNGDSSGSGTKAAKVSCYREIEEILKERSKNAPQKSSATPKSDSFVQFSDNGLEDVVIAYGSAEASGGSALSQEGQLDHEGHAITITTCGTVAAIGDDPWNWRDNSTDGGDDHAPYGGKVILVKLGDYARKIGIDGSPEAVKDTIRAVFGIRTRRPFWLEDEDQVVHTLDRNMPLGIYTLHFDEGITIKICLYDDIEQIPSHTEDKTIYTQADFCEFLTRRNWVGLRELNGFGSVDTMDDLCPGGMYRGVRLLTN